MGALIWPGIHRNKVVPRPQYFSPLSIVSGHVVRGEKCGQDKNPKTETIYLNFSLSRFHADFEGNSLDISGTVTARKKQFKLFAFVLTLTSQIKRPIWIQTDIIESEASPLSNHRQILITKIFRFCLYL